MDGHQNVAGTKFQTVTIAGKEYKMRVQSVGEIAECESYILSLRKPLSVVYAEMLENTPDAYKHIVVKTYLEMGQQPNYVTPEDVDEFRRTLKGLGWGFYRAVRDDHPEIDSVEAALDLLEQASKETMNEVLAKIAHLEEWDEIKNLLGLLMQRAQEADQEAESPGQESTNNSQNQEAGTTSKSTD